MGRHLAALVVSLAALGAFSVLVYGAPPLAALATVGGSLLMLVIWLGHIWARGRREARG